MNNEEIVLAVEHLTVCEPTNRGVAHKQLREIYPNIDAQGFNKVCDAYRESTGKILPASYAGKQRQARKEEMAFVQNASAADIRDNNKTMGNKPNAKFWDAWRLFKEGKWTTGKDILTLDDFIPHFEAGKAVKPDAEKVAKGVDTLLAGSDQLKTRGDAYNLLTDKGKTKMPSNEYSEIVKVFEETSGKKLVTSEASEERRAALKEVHNWNTAQLVGHLKSLDGKKPDARFWAAFDQRKLGKGSKTVDGNLFNNVLKNQPERQVDQAQGVGR